MSGPGSGGAAGRREPAPVADETRLDELARAYQAGSAEALVALHAALSREGHWLMHRARRRLPQAPSLEAADLLQESWLALAEAALAWSPERDGPFHSVALRALRAHLDRCLRRNRRRATARIEVAEGQAPDGHMLADATADSDADRWADALLARELVSGLPGVERRALVLHAVAERPTTRLARELGVSRRAATRLLAQARLQARALARVAPPAATLEAQVLAAAHAGCTHGSRRVPPTAWLVTRTGLGRRRVLATLARLGQLGYLRRRGQWWQLTGAEGEE